MVSSVEIPVQHSRGLLAASSTYSRMVRSMSKEPHLRLMEGHKVEYTFRARSGMDGWLNKLALEIPIFSVVNT